MAEDDVVFVFAHQDDEIVALTRIGWELARGARVWCCFLTDGARGVSAGVRDAESTAVLLRAGVARERIGFLGAPRRIADGELAFHAERALELLHAWAAGIAAIARVYTLDWEGGHPDHDAAHVIAAAFARDRGAASFLTFALYNGWRRRPGWFRVASFVPGPGALEHRRLGLREALAPVFAMMRYPSQRRTWLGLGPGFAVRALLRRRETLRHAEIGRLATRPHDGALLYETMFRVPAERVLAATEPLRTSLLAGAPPRNRSAR